MITDCFPTFNVWLFIGIEPFIKPINFLTCITSIPKPVMISIPDELSVTEMTYILQTHIVLGEKEQTKT